jgi:DNA-binding MarR family transcriptional regulator
MTSPSSAPLAPPGGFPGPGEIGAAVWRTQRAVERAVDARLTPFGWSAPVVRVMRLLAHEPGQSAADLARRLGQAPQSVALTIERAGQAGLLERRPHPVHGRVRQLYLTPAGHDAYRHAAGVIAELERDLADTLDPASAGLLWRGLRAITERAEALARTPRDTGAGSGRELGSAARPGPATPTASGGPAA